MIRGKRLFYFDTGGTNPAVVLGHSYLWDERMWNPQVKVLAQNFRVVVPILWGHGQSDAAPDGELSIQQLAADHWELLQTLDLGCFALVGLSVGGMWSVQLALDHPEAVAGLVLMDTYVGEEPAESKMRYFGMLSAVEQAGMIPPPILQAIPPLFFSQKTITGRPDLVIDFQNRLQKIPPEKIPTIVAMGRAIFGRQSLLERLSELNMPTIVVVGEDDLSRPVHEALQTAQILQAVCAVIPNAGHIATLEQPQVVNEVLAQFLESVCQGD